MEAKMIGFVDFSYALHALDHHPLVRSQRIPRSRLLCKFHLFRGLATVTRSFHHILNVSYINPRPYVARNLKRLELSNAHHWSIYSAFRPILTRSSFSSGSFSKPCTTS